MTPSGNGLIDKILVAVGKSYPGLLTESPTALQVFSISGAMSALFVQTVTKKPLNSNALQAVYAQERTFQSHMMRSPGLGLQSVGDDSFLATASKAVMTSESKIRPFINPVKSTAFKYNTGNEVIVQDSVKIKQLSDRFVSVNNWPSDAVHDVYARMLIDTAASLGSTPKVAMLSVQTTFNVTGQVDESGHWRKFLKNSYLKNAINKFPCIPGYSRVICVAGQGHGRALLCTYIPGPADIDHFNLETFLYDYNGSTGTTHFITTGRVPNKYAMPSVFANWSDWAMPVGWVNGFNLSSSQLDAACKRNVTSLRLADPEGVLLFGPPSVDLNVGGSHTVQDFLVQSENGLSIDVQLIDFVSEEFEWSLDKTWYADYMNTGFGVFTPRVSNIRENVLKQWSELSFNSITIRGTKEPYTPALTVLTLPEAQKYAKSRAKACKENDWLEKIAVVGTTITWRQVQDLETRTHGRVLWMNTSDEVLYDRNTDKFASSVAVTYTKDANEVITRSSEGLVTTIDLRNEDDMAQLTQDYYFNSNTKLVGFTIEILALTGQEKASLADAQLNLTTKESPRSENKVIGFGSWIDPTGHADVLSLSEEQKYRLHIRNCLDYDKMIQPLKKVLESFGYETLMKFLTSK